MFSYAVFSYVIGQISYPQMSSLSDHFALNTTLRNFCFLAHRHYFTKKQHSRFNFMLSHWNGRRKLHTAPLHIIATQALAFKMHYFIISSICFTDFLHFNTVRASSPHIFALHNILGSRPRARMLTCSASTFERVPTYVPRNSETPCPRRSRPAACVSN